MNNITAERMKELANKLSRDFTDTCLKNIPYDVMESEHCHMVIYNAGLFFIMRIAMVLKLSREEVFDHLRAIWRDDCSNVESRIENKEVN